MKYFLVKTILLFVLLSFSSLVHAIQLGKYEVSQLIGSDEKKIFSFCVQQGGQWYMSRDQLSWKGKWAKVSSPASIKDVMHKTDPKYRSKESSFIFQAISEKGGQLRSLSVDEGEYGINGAYYELESSTGKGSIVEISLNYKGARCAPYQVSASVSQPAASKDVYELRERDPLGPWKVGALYKNNRFDSCGMAIQGASGELTVVSKPKEEYERLYLPLMLKPNTQVKARVQFDQESPYDVEARVDADGAVWLIGREGLMSEFYGYAHMQGSGEIRNSRVMHVWVNGHKRTWQLTHTMYIPDVLEICTNQETNPSKVVEMWTDRFSLPQKTGVLRNEFTKDDKCLRVNSQSQLEMSHCTGAMWVSQLSMQGNYHVRPVTSAKNTCLTVDQRGQLFMRTCNNDASQEWIFQSWKGDPTHMRLKHSVAQNFCLDVVNDGRNNKVQMAPCANVSGQAWRSNLPDDMRF